MKVRVYVINAGQIGRYYGLKSAEDGHVLRAPNSWKTHIGAVRWALHHGMTVVD